MVFLYEEYSQTTLQEEEEKPPRMGMERTLLLGIGGLLGVLGMHGLVHLAKGGRPEAEPKGAARTALLGIGSLLGTLAMSEAIHIARSPQ